MSLLEFPRCKLLGFSELPDSVLQSKHHVSILGANVCWLLGAIFPSNFGIYAPNLPKGKQLESLTLSHLLLQRLHHDDILVACHVPYKAPQVFFLLHMYLGLTNAKKCITLLLFTLHMTKNGFLDIPLASLSNRFHNIRLVQRTSVHSINVSFVVGTLISTNIRTRK